MLLDY